MIKVYTIITSIALVLGIPNNSVMGETKTLEDDILIKLTQYC